MIAMSITISRNTRRSDDRKLMAWICLKLQQPPIKGVSVYKAVTLIGCYRNSRQVHIMSVRSLSQREIDRAFPTRREIKVDATEVAIPQEPSLR